MDPKEKAKAGSGFSRKPFLSWSGITPMGSRRMKFEKNWGCSLPTRMETIRTLSCGASKTC